MSEEDVEAINLTRMTCVTDRGVELKIDTMLDADGDETDDPDDAVVVVAQDPRGQWWAIELNAFERASIH